MNNIEFINDISYVIGVLDGISASDINLVNVLDECTDRLRPIRATLIRGALIKKDVNTDEEPEPDIIIKSNGDGKASVRMPDIEKHFNIP